jgi:predicted nucleic acid-binding protein
VGRIDQRRDTGVSGSLPLQGRDPEHAFLDANVIRGQLTTDILLTLAEQSILEPFWSQSVMDEMRRNRPAGVAEQKVDRRITTMNEYFPDALIVGYDHLIAEMQADAKDRHVLAAAVHSRSDVLVTDNVSDFRPPSTGGRHMRRTPVAVPQPKARRTT